MQIIKCINKIFKLLSPIYSLDGRPLPPNEPPYQVSESVSRITVDWGASLSPSHLPILNYTLTYWPVQDGQALDRAVNLTTDNETRAELTLFIPGLSYFIEVQGRNLIGLGEPSPVGMIATMLGGVPMAPASVTVSIKCRNEAWVVIIISWPVSCNTIFKLIK